MSGANLINTLANYHLQQVLLANTIGDWEDIYDSLDEQVSYPDADQTRPAISLACAESQSRMLILGPEIMGSRGEIGEGCTVDLVTL